MIKIIDFAKSNKPVMGICLGMQLLASSGDEDGPTEGLNLIPGCQKIKIKDQQFLPHMVGTQLSF